MAVRQRSGSYQADLMLAGKRYRETFPTLAAAHAWEAQVRAAHALGQSIPQATTRGERLATIMDLVRHVDRKHWSHKKAGPRLARNGYLYAEWVGANVSLEEALHEDTLEDYLRYRERELRSSGSTVNRHRAALSKLVTTAIRLGRITVRPDMVKRPEGDARTRIFTEAEEHMILSTCEAWGYHDLRDLFIWLCDTGCRLGETRELPWDAVMSNGIVDIPGSITKSGKGRTIAVTPRVMEALDRLRARYLDHTGPFSWVSERSVRALWDRLRGHLPWMDKHCVIHTYRHTCASRIVQETGDLYQAQRWLGHSTPITTQRYAKYAPKNMQDVAALLAKRAC